MDEIQKLLKRCWNDFDEWSDKRRPGSLFNMYLMETRLCYSELEEKYRKNCDLGSHCVLVYRNGELLLARRGIYNDVGNGYLGGFHIHYPNDARENFDTLYAFDRTTDRINEIVSKEITGAIERLKDKIKVPVDSGKVVSVYKLKDILIK